VWRNKIEPAIVSYAQEGDNLKDQRPVGYDHGLPGAVNLNGDFSPQKSLQEIR
jgi:hypothetical protein